MLPIRDRWSTSGHSIAVKMITTKLFDGIEDSMNNWNVNLKLGHTTFEEFQTIWFLSPLKRQCWCMHILGVRPRSAAFNFSSANTLDSYKSWVSHFAKISSSDNDFCCHFAPLSVSSIKITKFKWNNECNTKTINCCLFPNWCYWKLNFICYGMAHQLTIIFSWNSWFWIK